MASLANKVGIVTGGGTGIGRATALAMARAGASLVIGNRGAKLGEAVVRAIEQAGGRAVFQVTDVSKPEEAKALVQRAVKEFGRLDLAFNNAGADGEQMPLHEQDIEKASLLFDVNIKGVFYCMKYEIEEMLRTGGGSIVNFATTEPLEASTLPNRTAINRIVGRSASARREKSASSAWQYISAKRLVAPSMETGSIALSVEIITMAAAPAAAAASATLTEPNTLVLIPSSQFASKSGTCLSAAAWKTMSGLKSVISRR